MLFAIELQVQNIVGRTILTANNRNPEVKTLIVYYFQCFV
jgi:hypothetical protein